MLHILMVCCLDPSNHFLHLGRDDQWPETQSQMADVCKPDFCDFFTLTKYVNPKFYTQKCLKSEICTFLR